MDMKQEETTTLHDLCMDNEKLMKNMQEITRELPVCLILPMLYNEIKNDALENIIKQLNTCTFLKEVIVALSAKSEEEFNHVKKFFTKLSIPKLIMWCNGQKIENLITTLIPRGITLTEFRGKGRDVWLALGIASIESYGIALHDADIQGYTASIPTRLLYPIVEPELDFKFNKGYYARISADKTIMYGRVFRLFVQPLLRSFIDLLDDEPDFIRFLRSFRYPLSGEFALTSDLARDLDIPGGWGIEIDVLAEMYRNVATKRICQTDLGFYEHKHQAIGKTDCGLVKMAGEIFKTLLRVLIEEDHIKLSKSFLLSIQVLYQKNAQEIIRKYYADANINNIHFDRHLEESTVEQFSQELVKAGNEYLLQPVGTRMPDWLRTMTARKKIREELLTIVSEQNRI